MAVPSGLVVWCNAGLETRLSTEEFCDQLKDGVILCRLLNSILQKSPIRFAEKPNRFQKTSNILAFLAGCSEIGVAPLFHSDVLLAGKDLTPVFACLEGLRQFAFKHGYQPEAGKRESTALLPITATAQSLIDVPAKGKELSPEAAQKLRLAEARQILLQAQIDVHNSSAFRTQLCIQCKKSYTIPSNHSLACRFHGVAFCCNHNRDDPCQVARHRSKHHSDWKYPSWHSWYTHTLQGRTELIEIRDADSNAAVAVSLAAEPEAKGHKILISQPDAYLAVYDWLAVLKAFRKGRTTVLHRKYPGGGLVTAEWLDLKGEACSLLLTVRENSELEPSIARVLFSNQLAKQEVRFEQDNRLRVCRPPAPYPPLEGHSTTLFEFPPDWRVDVATDIPARGDLGLASKLHCSLLSLQDDTRERWSFQLHLSNPSREQLILTSIQLEYRTVPGAYQPVPGFAELPVLSILFTKVMMGAKLMVPVFTLYLDRPADKPNGPALNSQHALRFRLTVRDFRGRVHVGVTEVPRGSSCVFGQDDSPGSTEFHTDWPQFGIRYFNRFSLRSNTRQVNFKLAYPEPGYIIKDHTDSATLCTDFAILCRRGRSEKSTELPLEHPRFEVAGSHSVRLSAIIDTSCHRPAYLRLALATVSHRRVWFLPIEGPPEVNQPGVEVREPKFSDSAFAKKLPEHGPRPANTKWEMFDLEPREADIDFQPLDDLPRKGDELEKEKEQVKGNRETAASTAVRPELVVELNHQFGRLAESLKQLGSLKLR